VNVARQLFQLQELELGIESDEQALSHLTGQLGQSPTVIKAREKLDSEQKRLDGLKHQQHDLEWEIDDISSKLSTIEDGLFSGRVKNPKELTSLQHEAQGMKAKCSQLEDKVLELMEQVDFANASISNLSSDLKKIAN
jgi:predicted  nucleic acid-binding Zn-ribbon protein